MQNLERFRAITLVVRRSKFPALRSHAPVPRYPAFASLRPPVVESGRRNSHPVIKIRSRRHTYDVSKERSIGRLPFIGRGLVKFRLFGLLLKVGPVNSVMVMATDLTYPDALPSNTRLHCYVLEGVLGQGGFAVTYLARDTYLDQPVAIKEYFPVDIAQRGAEDTVRARSVDLRERYRWGLDRFLFEARTLARFDHPNIVRVLSVFQQNGTAYMVMRYEKGGNLSALLDHVHTLPEPQLLGILLPILEGIELVHDAKFIHRDIKPDNIYIRADDSPVLLDFGSARQALGEPRTMTALVTSGYTPFEQYQSDATCGPWTDIYSLAATCYRAIAGVSPGDVLIRVKSSLGSLDDPMVPAQVVGKGRYSPSLLTAIDQALKISEKERPQTVREWRHMMAPPSSAKPHRPDVIDLAGDRQAPIVDTKSARDGAGHPSERSRKMTRRSYRWTPVVWAAGVSVVVSIAVVSVWLFLTPRPDVKPTASGSPPIAPTQLAPAPPTPPQPPESKPESVASLADKSSPLNEAGRSKPALPMSEGAATPPPAKKTPPARVLEPRATSSGPERGGAVSQKATPAAGGPVSAPAVAQSVATASTSESTSVPTSSPAPVEPPAAPAPPVAALAIAPKATISTERPNANVTNEPGSQAGKPIKPTDDESLAAAGDPDAQLRLGDVYAAGKNGHPNAFFAYVYFKLALLGGKGEAEGLLKEQARKLQPPEIKQADAKVDSLLRSYGGAAKQKAP